MMKRIATLATLAITLVVSASIPMSVVSYTSGRMAEASETMVPVGSGMEDVCWTAQNLECWEAGSLDEFQACWALKLEANFGETCN